MFNRRLVSLVGNVPVYRAGGLGSIPSQPNTQLRRRCCLCSNICKWLGFRVFSEKDVKT